jgi:nicotinamidase-related amidase
MWQRYYTRWRVATREVLDLRLLELMAPLAALCPPATVIDKTRYSAFAEPRMIEHHGTRSGRADYLGIRTDVRVLATLLDAVDIGYRVIVVRDAICSSSDKGRLRLRQRSCLRRVAFFVSMADRRRSPHRRPRG